MRRPVAARVGVLLTGLLACAALASGAEKQAPVEWTHQGYPSLVEAAAKAKQEKQRLLIGLSGGDT